MTADTEANDKFAFFFETIYLPARYVQKRNEIIVYFLYMGLESNRSGQGSERMKDPTIVAQIELAQLAAGTEDHKAAMREWLDGGEESLAAHFREYIEKHPDEPLDVHDKSAMEALLEKIRTYH